VEIKNWEEIDADMQQGYSYSIKNEAASACIVWKKAWRAIVEAMNAGNISTIEDFDENFTGLQNVLIWAYDYETELENATEVDISFAKDRISFCTEYMDRTSDNLDFLNMRTAIANSYFRLGMIKEGEKIYKAITSENPAWGYGWLKWAEEYSIYEKNRDYGKAIEILKKALKVKGVSERVELKYRLREIYEDGGMHEEASSIIIDEWDYGIPLSEINNVASVLKEEMETTVSNILELIVNHEDAGEVGRNDPCPCGSGKKYKKCCMEISDKT
jgi:tetratricopeptide (TPR) repeat protein